MLFTTMFFRVPFYFFSPLLLRYFHITLCCRLSLMIFFAADVADASRCFEAAILRRRHFAIETSHASRCCGAFAARHYDTPLSYFRHYAEMLRHAADVIDITMRQRCRRCHLHAMRCRDYYADCLMRFTLPMLPCADIYMLMPL